MRAPGAIRRFIRRGHRAAAGRIAILRLYGPITGGARSAEWVEEVRRLARVQRVPAVVLDVDSPGGSAPAADYMFLALARLAKRKPLVAHIRGVGASGSYLAALAARRIVVAPNALVARVGVRVQETKAGSLKGIGAPWRDETAEEIAKEQELVNAYYEAFVARTAEGRNLSADRARELATGEVWIGSRAVELGLADEVGDIDRAITVAAEIAGVPARGARVSVRRSLIARLVDQFALRLIGGLADAVEELSRRGPRY